MLALSIFQNYRMGQTFILTVGIPTCLHVVTIRNQGNTEIQRVLLGGLLEAAVTMPVQTRDGG